MPSGLLTSVAEEETELGKEGHRNHRLGEQEMDATTVLSAKPLTYRQHWA